jgi:hypothetical protein
VPSCGKRAFRVISGTPSTAGAYNVTLTGKDLSAPSGSVTFTWTIGSSGGGGGGGSGCTAGQLLGNPGRSLNQAVVAPSRSRAGFAQVGADRIL